MSKTEFKLPPLSPLIGSGLSNYLKVTKGKKIDSKYWLKYILTGAIITILTPFRWYEKLHFRKVSHLPIKDPVFILGHWRSGTTHLHNLMCQPPDAGFVTTYETVFTNFLASQKILKPFMGFLMPDKRPSDNVKLNVEYPQEEEFALSNMTVASYYHFFYFPELTDLYFKEFVALKTSKDMIRKFEDSYIKLLQKAAATMPTTKYLVIKNPVNTGRFDELKKLFPDGKFIHIYRNPFTVFLSTKKFFKELMPTLWFHSITEEEIEDLVIRTYVKIYDVYYKSESGLEDVYEVRFEEFEKDPIRYLKEIYENLGIKGWAEAEEYLVKYQASMKSYKKNKYSISRREYELVKTHWNKYLERWNYDLPDNMEVVD